MSDPAATPAAPPISGESRLILLWMVIVLAVVFVPFLLFAIRRATIPGSGARRKGRKPLGKPVDPWAESGRRLVGESAPKRLDDTVDIDPFDPEDEPW